MVKLFILIGDKGVLSVQSTDWSLAQTDLPNRLRANFITTSLKIMPNRHPRECTIVDMIVILFHENFIYKSNCICILLISFQEDWENWEWTRPGESACNYLGCMYCTSHGVFSDNNMSSQKANFNEILRTSLKFYLDWIELSIPLRVNNKKHLMLQDTRYFCFNLVWYMYFYVQVI